MAWVALISGLVLTLAHFWGLASPFVINDDVRQQISWMQRWGDPELYPGDILRAQASHYVSWGVQAIYRLAAFFIDPLYFSKILPCLLFPLLGMSLFAGARRLGGRPAAWCAGALLWLTTLFAGDMAGGLSRAFAAPLLALFLSCWLAGRGWGMALALVAQALCIPYIFPVCAGAALLGWAIAYFRKPFSPPPFPRNVAHWSALALGVGLVYFFQRSLQEAGLGPMVSLEQVWGQPEFGPQGRCPILPLPSLVWELVRPWGEIAPFREAGPGAGVLTALALSAGGLAGWRRRGWEPWRACAPLGLILVSSLVCYLLARAVALKLSFPDRYLIYSLACLYCLLLALGWSAWLDLLPRRRGVAALLLALAALLGALRLHGLELYDYSEHRQLYAALARTPKDCLVAGHPYLMDNVLTFGRRPVLASYELSFCWQQGYWLQVKPRLHDMLQAYYASDPDEIGQLARRWGVCYLVVDKRHFTPDFLAGQPMFAPYDVMIRQAAAQGSFAALQRGIYPAQIIDDNVSILDLRAWRGPDAPASPARDKEPQPAARHQDSLQRK